MKRLGITLSIISFIALLTAAIMVLFNKVDVDGEGTKEKIYATDITISANFRSLSLFVGNSLRFKETPYSVTPSNYNQGVEIKILNYLGKERYDATFKNNCFTAAKTGTYYLRFIVKTRYDTVKYDVIKISVIDNFDQNCKGIKLKQDATTIFLEENIDIFQFVIVNNLGTSNLRYNSSEGRMVGSIFIPNGVGSYNIEIIIDNGDYLIFKCFIVNVKVDEKVNLCLYDKQNNKIEDGNTFKCRQDEVLLFSYIVEGLTIQLITLEIKNLEIVSLISCDAPLIVLEVLNIGETEIIIKIPNKDYIFKFFVFVE